MKHILLITLITLIMSGCATHRLACDVEERDDLIVENCSGEITKYCKQEDGRYMNEGVEYEPIYELTSYGKYRSIIRHAGGGDRKTFCRSTRTGVINSTECFTEK